MSPSLSIGDMPSSATRSGYITRNSAAAAAAPIAAAMTMSSTLCRRFFLLFSSFLEPAVSISIKVPLQS